MPIEQAGIENYFGDAHRASIEFRKLGNFLGQVTDTARRVAYPTQRHMRMEPAVFDTKTERLQGLFQGVMQVDKGLLSVTDAQPDGPWSRGDGKRPGPAGCARSGPGP